jgi:hypothetical protein
VAREVRIEHLLEMVHVMVSHELDGFLEDERIVETLGDHQYPEQHERKRPRATQTAERRKR